MASDDLLELYREEVEELTGKLHTDPGYADLRSVLSGQGFDPTSVLLAALVEDEHSMEYGAIVTPQRQVIEYARRIDLHPDGPGLVAWQDRTSDADFERRCPQVPVALQMLRPE